MKNRIYRDIDKNGRLNIPDLFLKLTGIKCGDEIAFVTVGEDMISFVKFEESLNVPIIWKTKSDDKGRIRIPKEFRGEITTVEIFMYQGKITIR